MTGDMETDGGVVTADPRDELRIVAGVLAVLVALLHLFHPQLGAPRLVTFLELGQLYHPLPPVFTATAVLIVFGIVLVYRGITVRWVYLGGIVLMLGLVVGYGVWHTFLDHGAFWPSSGGRTHTDRNPLVLLLLHLRTDTLGAISKILELLLAAVLGMLYLLESPSDTGERR